MNYTVNDYAQYCTDEEDLALESYKSMKMTWGNAEKITRTFSDKIEVETDLNKVVELETEYLNKINDIYSDIADDKLSVSDEMLSKYIPTMINVISILSLILTVYKYEENSKVTNFLSIAGIGGIASQLATKLKRTTIKSFKKDCIESLDAIREGIKNDIQINQKFISFGITTRDEANKCTVKTIKNGGVEIYRKYE